MAGVIPAPRPPGGNRKWQIPDFREARTVKTEAFRRIGETPMPRATP
jgi:hypothetical protein